jgi:hypothetical protein
MVVGRPALKIVTCSEYLREPAILSNV